jgi:hypothetical protein
LRGVSTYEWVFDAAQTDFALVTPSAGQSLSATFACVTTSGGTSVDVQCRIGFATTTLPTVTVNSASGNAGIFFTHGGIRPGGGWSVASGGAPLAIGSAGQPIRATFTVPTGGQLRITLSLALLDQ